MPISAEDFQAFQSWGYSIIECANEEMKKWENDSMAKWPDGPILRPDT